MAEERLWQSWNHTSQVIAAIYNSQPRKKAVEPRQFHPFLNPAPADGKKPETRNFIPNVGITALKFFLPRNQVQKNG